MALQTARRGSSPPRSLDTLLERSFVDSRLWDRAHALLRPTGVALDEPADMWTPQIEAFMRGKNFVVRADLPGMKKEDINVELDADGLTLYGERHDEHSEEHDGYYRSERSYGSFYRTVPLPEGAIADDARAEFKDGVLEIVMAAPPQETRKGRKLEIK